LPTPLLIRVEIVVIELKDVICTEGK